MEVAIDKLSTTTWGTICGLLVMGIVFLALYVRALVKSHSIDIALVHDSKDRQGREFLQMFAENSSDSIAQLKDLGATLDAIKGSLERLERRE